MSNLSDEDIKAMWPEGCTLCGEVMEERHIVQSIVPLTIKKLHCTDFYTRTYCVCTKCYESKELI